MTDVHYLYRKPEGSHLATFVIQLILNHVVVLPVHRVITKTIGTETTNAVTVLSIVASIISTVAAIDIVTAIGIVITMST